MIKIPTLFRVTSAPALHYCSCRLSSTKDQNSQLPVKHEEKVTDPAKPKLSPHDVTADDMRWRTPWHQKEGYYYSFLRTFYKKQTNTGLLKKIQAPIDLSPASIKSWWEKKKEYEAIVLQSYLPERNRILGNELAAAHFIVHRGGAVKFHNDDKWIKADENNNYVLPRFFEEGWDLEAIDCTDMDLYYEGLVNLRDLDKVEWLSFNGCQHIDDWCLDRISNIFSHSLVYLDLRNCPKITNLGIGALYKLDKLKILYLDDFLKSTTYELTCLLLEEVNPNLDIRSDVVTFEITK